MFKWNRKHLGEDREEWEERRRSRKGAEEEGAGNVAGFFNIYES